jgi:hypothetical protein
MAQVDVMTGRLWQDGCGPGITEAYLSGTEPREPCGGGFEGDQMMAFEEPAMISEQQAMEMSGMEGNHDNEIVVDPADSDPTAQDDSSEDSAVQDSLLAQPQRDTTRQSANRRRPIADRPPSRVSQPIRQPVDSQPPPPARDTIPKNDSLALR